MQTDVLPLLDELQTIARTGLNFATDPYDRERYQRLLDLACRYYGQALGLPAESVRSRLVGELGYITPKVGADAAVFDEHGRILLVERADDGRWGLPCGWVDSNESPRDAAVRETREETGLEVEPLRLVDVFFRPASAEDGPHSTVSVVYLCEVRGGSIRLSHEVREAQYWEVAVVPAWHRDHLRYAEAARAAWQGTARPKEPLKLPDE